MGLAFADSDSTTLRGADDPKGWLRHLDKAICVSWCGLSQREKGRNQRREDKDEAEGVEVVRVVIISEEESTTNEKEGGQPTNNIREVPEQPGLEEHLINLTLRARQAPAGSLIPKYSSSLLGWGRPSR